MSVNIECIGCRQVKQFAVNEKYRVCSECLEYDKQRHKKLYKNETIDCCPLCGYVGPSMQNHHIYGRKNSDVTIRICANCHYEIHYGERELING